MKCIHLDFHTSPDIEGIGEKFNRDEFIKTIKDSHIDLMTVFAKCHHGYSYFPTKVGTMHPHLKFNLLKEQQEAIRAAGAKAPIYIPIGWSKKDADEHPEWHQIDFFTKKPAYIGDEPSDDPNAPISDCSWTTLCPSGSYLDYVEEVTREVCENFDVSDGILFDICYIKDACVCESCMAGMKKMGLNPENYEDAKKYYVIKHIEMAKRLTTLVHSYFPDAHTFYNSGGADMDRTEYHDSQTHFELEDLPTAWGGYDLMPLRAKYFERYGKFYLGMTGKFHHCWGEFGGFKNKDALLYECADMQSVGASISVGDHLHPSGKIDKSTYNIIGYAFDYISKIEKYCENTKAYTDIAIWLSHNNPSDMGAAKLVQTMHLEFDVIESGESLDKYSCVILPDRVKLTDLDKAALVDYVNGGGKIVASYDSAFNEIGIEKLSPSEYDKDFIECEIEEFTTPFLAYSSAYKIKCEGGDVLAKVYEPYFSRTHGHFCGHKNTPNKLEAADYPALVKRGGVIYFAHPVFSAYHESGSYVLERYIMKGIDEVYERSIRTENLPATARVRLRKSNEDSFLALHTLYSPPINRGIVCLLSEFPTLHGVKITLKTDKKIKEALSAVSGERVEFTQHGNEVTLNLNPIRLHELTVLRW